MNTIQIKRGENRPNENGLAEFELGFAKKEKELYIGVPEVQTGKTKPVEISSVYIGSDTPPGDSNYKIWVDISNTLPDIGRQRSIKTTIDPSGYIDVSPITMASTKGALIFLNYSGFPYIYLWINNKVIYQNYQSNESMPINEISVTSIPQSWLFDPTSGSSGKTITLLYYTW